MSDPKPTKEDEGRARVWLGKQFPGHFMNADIASLTAEFASVADAAEAALADRTDEVKRIVDEVLADRWPVDVFPAPAPKEHGTVDACSARALRAVIPGLRDEIKRRLKALK